MDEWEWADPAITLDEWQRADSAIALEQITAWSCRRMDQGVDDSELLPYSGAKPCGGSSKLRYARASETHDIVN